MPKIVSSDDIRISYDVDGSGPTVLLLHGYATDAYINWVRPGVVDRLNAAGYRTISVDQRGHGMSDKPHEPEAYSSGAMLEDARAVLDDAGVERCAAVGYSMGALNTLRLITSGEERIGAAVLGGIGDLSIRMREGANAIADAMLTDDKSTIAHPIAKSFRDFADLTKADKVALAALQRRAPDPITGIEAVDIPVLVLAGDNDPMIGDPSALAQMFRNGRVAVVGGSHLNVVNNRQFHDELVAFLDAERETFA